MCVKFLLPVWAWLPIPMCSNYIYSLWKNNQSILESLRVYIIKYYQVYFIYTKMFQICAHFKKCCRFVFYLARAFIWGITWPSTTSISFLYLYGSCLARIIGKTRPRPFWDPRPRWNTGPGRTMSSACIRRIRVVNFSHNKKQQ